MMRRLMLFLSLLALATPEIVSYTLQQPAAATPPSAGFGTIHGTIVREGTNDPIPDVAVTLTGRGGMTAQEAQLMLNALARGGALASNLPAEVIQNAQEAVRGGAAATAIVTNSAGEFTIQNVPVGPQTIRAQLEGFFGTGVNGVYPALVSLPVTVTKDQTSTLKITMVRGGTITGRVLDPAGKPLTGSPVQILRSGYQNGASTLQISDIKEADDRGEFRLYQLPPGEYYIAASPRPVGPLGPQPNAGTNSQGVPVATFYPNVTDPSAATRIDLKSGDELAGINIQLRTVQPTKVAGRVTTMVPPGPATGAQGQPRLGGVMLVPSNSTGLLNLDVAGTIPLQADGGLFEFKDVAPGTYDVIARISTARGGGWGPQAPPATATGPWALGRASVDTRNGSVANADIVVRTGVDLRGTLLVDGKPTRATVRITLQPDDAVQNANDQQVNLMFNQIRQYSAPIAEDGSFLIPLIPEGRYILQVSLNAPPAVGRGAAAQAAANLPPPAALPANAYLADIRQGGTSVYDNGLRVGSDALNPIEVLVNSSGGSLEGNVLGTDQKPVPAMTVVLVPPDDRRQNAALYKNARSDAQGHFTIQNLAPGRYTLYAWESVAAGAYQNAEFMSRYTGRGTVVTVQAGARTNGNVNLIRP